MTGQFRLWIYSLINMGFLIVPSAPPLNVRGHSTSASSIRVDWHTVPVADQNGIILTYTVTYKALPGGSPQRAVVSAPTIQVSLIGLMKYRNYRITVFASNAKGNGPTSQPIIVTTDQDGKLSKLLDSITQRITLPPRIVTGEFCMWVYLWINIGFHIAPSAPPRNVRGHSTSATSIRVDWYTVPVADQNGIILTYTVTYKALPGGGPHSAVVSAPITQARLTGLMKYRKYRITVFASTAKGNGPTSQAITVTTDQDSKFSMLSPPPPPNLIASLQELLFRHD